jgi:hypothetical protein
MKMFRFPNIKQTRSNDCPNCGKKDIRPYGQVDEPPIEVQLADGRFNIKREWLANRHRCPDCNGIFDNIIINHIKDNGNA